jgi:hypothetical protein
MRQRFGKAYQTMAEVKDEYGMGRLNSFVTTVRDQLNRMDAIATNLSKKPDVSQADLIGIQFEVMQMGIILDVASKLGDKGSNAVQTLFRNQ